MVPLAAFSLIDWAFLDDLMIVFRLLCIPMVVARINQKDMLIRKAFEFRCAYQVRESDCANYNNCTCLTLYRANYSYIPADINRVHGDLPIHVSTGASKRNGPNMLNIFGND